MAVRIRMKRLGRRNLPFWRICATDKRTARDGRVIEELGHYDPHRPNEDKIALDRDRVVHWLKQGAWPSKTVTELLGHLGLDAKGNEIPPKPWPKKKQQAPPPKAAERIAAEKAKAETQETAETEAEPAEASPEAEQPEGTQAEETAESGERQEAEETIAEAAEDQTGDPTEASEDQSEGDQEDTSA